MCAHCWRSRRDWSRGVYKRCWCIWVQGMHYGQRKAITSTRDCSTLYNSAYNHSHRPLGTITCVFHQQLQVFLDLLRWLHSKSQSQLSKSQIRCICSATLLHCKGRTITQSQSERVRSDNGGHFTSNTMTQSIPSTMQHWTPTSSSCCTCSKRACWAHTPDNHGWSAHPSCSKRTWLEILGRSGTLHDIHAQLITYWS